MRNGKKRLIVPLLTVGGLAGWMATSQLAAKADDKNPKSPVSVVDLEKKKGPKPPSGATLTGTEAHPMVGEIQLPIQNVQVYQFNVKTQSGMTVPVKWAYTPGTGTFLWATAPIECGDGSTIARGGFAMKIREDGSGAYALGTSQCPTARVYGCGFDAQHKETRCGACAFNNNDLVCAED